MQNFLYHRPGSLTELKEQLSQPGARLLAGGTDIIPKMRRGKFSAAVLVDSSGIKSLRFIEDQGDEIVIGALTTHQEIADSALLGNVSPALTSAAASIGCLQTRCRGTLGGNLANASPAADTMPPLLAYEASVLLQSLKAERIVRLEDFSTGPGETGLRPGEFIHSVMFAPLQGRSGSAFIKVGQRNGMAISIVNAAAALVLDGSDRIEVVRIAVGSVGPVVIRCRRAEKFLQGQEAGGEVFQAAAELCREEISPIADIRSSEAYRLQAAVVVVRRVLESTLQQVRERTG